MIASMTAASAGISVSVTSSKFFHIRGLFRAPLPFNPQITSPMLSYSLLFLIVAIVAGALGFWGISGVAASVAKVLFLVFLVLFVISLLSGRRRPPV